MTNLKLWLITDVAVPFFVRTYQYIMSPERVAVRKKRRQEREDKRNRKKSKC